MINLRPLDRVRFRHHESPPVEIHPKDAAILLTAFRFGVDTARLAEIAMMPERDVVRAITQARELVAA